MTATWSLVTLKTRETLLPLIVRSPLPGPSMIRSLSRTNSPLVRVMMPVTEKLMVSPEEASPMACRREPAPLSPVDVTISLVATGETTVRELGAAETSVAQITTDSNKMGATT